jgi:hypothetical protein
MGFTVISKHRLFLQEVAEGVEQIYLFPESPKSVTILNLMLSIGLFPFLDLLLELIADLPKLLCGNGFADTTGDNYLHHQQ